ncbi:MAG: tetratricopeptide repeat protein [Myxococcota bacterium]
MRTFVLATVLLYGGLAHAQDLQRGLKAYEGGQYAEAAAQFYEVLARDTVEDKRDTAEVYLADCLKRLGLYVPAYFYYRDLFEAGPKNRFYLAAIAGLLDVRDALHDHLYVAIALDEHYDPQAFGQLDKAQAERVNFIIGELSFRQRKYTEAQRFLEAVTPESVEYSKARYLLGVLAARAGDNQRARGHFMAVRGHVKADSKNSSASRERDLALIAAARSSYALGEYAEASKLYEEVPRASEQWFTAIYETSWAHFRDNDFGRAMGDVESVLSPYFARRHVPEVWVVRATTYFVNCQWDRVRATYDVYRRTYEPMTAELERYLGGERAPATYYRDILAEGAKLYAPELAREVRRGQRFKDFHFELQHMAWESRAIAGIAAWGNQRIGRDLRRIIDEQRGELEAALGRHVVAQLRYLQDNLKNFTTQMRILDFEVADAERNWLEQGREILKNRRGRLPRPEIPSDAWQHWSQRKEVWLDELGYYRHTLRSECLRADEEVREASR